jgi:uncharacterized protein YgiM (DUF1202 family)/transglutaminase-like putative cysteine protease
VLIGCAKIDTNNLNASTQATTEPSVTVDPTIPSAETNKLPSDDIEDTTIPENEPSQTTHPTEPSTNPSIDAPEETPTVPPETEPIEPPEDQTVQPTEPKPTEPEEPAENPTEPTMPEHKHEYESKTTKPTCIDAGYTTYSCKCGDVYFGEQTKALGHDYQSQIIDPTTENQGYIKYECSRCGDCYKDHYTDKLPFYQPVDETVYVTGTSILNVRTGPGTSYEKIGTLPKDAAVKRIGVGDNGWSKIIHNNKEAYVSSSYLTKTKPAEKIDLSKYQKKISYAGLTSQEIQIITDLMDQYAKNKDTKDLVWITLDGIIEWKTYRTISSFVGIQLSSYDGVLHALSLCTDTTNSTTDIRILVDDYEELLDNKRALDAKIESILSTLKEGSEEYKLQQIADWLRDNIDYKEKGLEPLEALKTGKGNCNAFAMLFQAMASRLGIQCDICVGYSDTGRHAWNRVTFSNGDIRFYDVCYYNSSGNSKHLNQSQSRWPNYEINSYWDEDEFNPLEPDDSTNESKLNNDVEYVNLREYQTNISFAGLTEKEIRVVKALLEEYEKYKDGAVSEIRYCGNDFISYDSYRRLNSFFAIFFYNWTDKEDFMSVINSGGISDAVLHEDEIDKYIQEKAEIDQFAENALSKIKEGTDEYKLQQIADWLSGYFAYESGNVDAYNAVKTGKANCNAFAFLFKAMVSKIGIQCDICVGYSNTGKHAWNRVTFSDGRVRFYDVCYYNSSDNTKYLNRVESIWGEHSINNYV